MPQGDLAEALKVDYLHYKQKRAAGWLLSILHPTISKIFGGGCRKKQNLFTGNVLNSKKPAFPIIWVMYIL